MAKCVILPATGRLEPGAWFVLKKFTTEMREAEYRDIGGDKVLVLFLDIIIVLLFLMYYIWTVSGHVRANAISNASCELRFYTLN